MGNSWTCNLRGAEGNLGFVRLCRKHSARPPGAELLMTPASSPLAGVVFYS